MEAICQAYIDLQITITPGTLITVVADHLRSLNEDARGEFTKAVRARRLAPDPELQAD